VQVEAAYKPRNDRSLELIHAGETRAANAKTLDFSPLSEFSVATGKLKSRYRFDIRILDNNMQNK